MLRKSIEQRDQQNFGCLKSTHFTYQLSKCKNIIGRNSTCNIVVNHPSISKEHALIEYDSQKNIAIINDLSSTNGTYVNNEKINGSMYLHQNDRLKFGKDDTVYSLDLYSPMTPMLNSNINMPSTESISKGKDNKISLVNDTSYRYSNVNHFNGQIPQLIKSQSYREPKHEGQESSREHLALGKSNELNNMKNHDPVLFEEISKQRGYLTDILKQKTTELDETTKKLLDSKNQLTLLQNKNDELKQSINELKKKNESYEVELKFKNDAIKNLQDPNGNNNKLLLEKEQLIFLLHNELKFYKQKSHTFQVQNATEKLNENNELSKKLDELMLTYSQEQSKMQKINIDLTLKNTELTKNNTMLNDTIKNLINEKTTQGQEYQRLIYDYDNRLFEAMSKLPKNFDGFNVKKEEAAKYLVEQMDIYLKEKQTILNENLSLKNTVSILTIDNKQLKHQLDISVNYNQNNTTNQPMVSPRSQECNSHHTAIQNQIDHKTKEIELLKEQLNNPIINNIDDARLIDSIVSTLKKKDNEIEHLKKGIY